MPTPPRSWRPSWTGTSRAFEFFGGVFSELWYDNPKTAVVKILSGPERIEHEHLSRLRAHYLFESSFCTPGEAHEKGSVEKLVGYVRRNALVPASKSFASFEELNDHLLSFCERERGRHAAAWEMEEAALEPLPLHPFRASTSRPVCVSKTALCRIDHNRYSVPVMHAGQVLRAEVYADKVEIYAGEKLVATHARCYARDLTFFDLGHYLPVFARKPRAAACCAALSQADPVFTRARDLLLARARRLPGLRRDPHAGACATILPCSLKLSGSVWPPAGSRWRPSGNAASTSPMRSGEPIELPELSGLPLAPPDLARYDALLVVAR